MCDATNRITQASQRWQITINFALAILAALAAVTAVISVEYYRLLREAQEEYQNARDVVEDVVMSFNRELKREAEQLDLIAFKLEGNFARADESLIKVEALEKKVLPLEEQVSSVSQSLRQASESILSGLTGLDGKIKEIETAQETVKAKIAGFDEQIQKLKAAPESPIEPSIPVMPIRRDKAMAALTDTEIQVLEMLSAEGSKTAPEIKDRVRLSREHTARLMKKLYEEGYLEREAGKIPFKYSIKAEMEKLLKKTESTPADLGGSSA
jgi:archaellum component FlaC/DNA-binding CsgD family transcriptional regulator